ncbi:MAG: hypothetical protein DMG57_32535 [Acidobacteria bacterium]|nr:MAG: hypothetical protein DMG57_32535 [Acidobacteriota bacterium]
MPEVCYRTGQAAKLLGRSSYEIRRLAESGLIGAEYSGKQWRIPAAEVERLRKDGVPEIPSSGMIGGNGAARPASNKSVANGLLAPPSEDLIDSTEDLIATENLLKKRRLERELEETEDWFRDREASDAERIAEQEDAAQARIDARQAEREKMKREAKWMRYALNSVPYEARGEMDLAIHNQVRAALGALHLDEPDSTVRRRAGN